MPKLLSVTLTDEHAELVAAALRDASNSEDVTLEQSQVIYDLGYIFQTASEEPWRFPVPPKLAATLRSHAGNPNAGNTGASRRNRRKARQEKRQGGHKERRRLAKKIAESYNAAVAVMEQENAEAEEYRAEVEARVATQPKFRVLTVDGQILLDGIPLEFLQTAEGEPVTPGYFKPQIIVPGK